MNNATVVQAVNTVNKARSEVLVVKEKGISSSSGSRPALVPGNFIFRWVWFDLFYSVSEGFFLGISVQELFKVALSPPLVFVSQV